MVVPLSAVWVKATVTWALPRVTLVMVGASGTAAGVTGSDGREAVLVPTSLVAVTVHVYVFPLVRPLTVLGGSVVEVLVADGLVLGGVQVAAVLVMSLALLAGRGDAAAIKWGPRKTVGCAGALGAA